MNAMYGNIADKPGACRNAARMLRVRGHLVVSHPEGRAFVDQLRDASDLFLESLPRREEFQTILGPLGLNVIGYRDQRVSLQNILLPTVFSPCSETALTYGVGLCHRYDTTLYTVTVVPEEITDYIQPPDPFCLRHFAENNMANLVKSELFQGIKHYELVKEGSVSEVLSDLIDGLEIDLVVLGTHGRGGIKKLVLGSVAEEIVNCAPCAVLTVGPHISSEWVSEAKLRRILYATDLLPDSARALTYALWLAEQELLT